MAAIRSSSHVRPRRGRPIGRLLAFTALSLVVFASLATSAFAGAASSGELFFYPCTSCHPLGANLQPLHPLPNGFTGHQIVLQGHDKLGPGKAACLVCHDDPTRNPGMLKTVDGSLTDIKTGDIATVCERCHEDKYAQFKAGTHGKHKASCVAAGCHDPHTPQYIYAAPVTPFIATGFQFQVVRVRTPFMALPPPAPNPATVIPSWFLPLAVIGFVVAGGLIGSLVQGRVKR